MQKDNLQSANKACIKAIELRGCHLIPFSAACEFFHSVNFLYLPDIDLNYRKIDLMYLIAKI